MLRRDSIVASEKSGIELPSTEMFSAYRDADGVMIPFRQGSNNIANGEIVLRIIDVKFNANIPDSVFRKPAPVSRQ